MIRDERIVSASNRVAARGFGLGYVLSLLALLYRQFYLGQPVQEYWDMALIFFVVTSYVTLASIAQGAVHETRLVRYGKWTIPVSLMTILAVMDFRGQIQSAADVVVSALSALAGLALVGFVFYALYRRWEKRSGLDA